jgi:hypothetical protein
MNQAHWLQGAVLLLSIAWIAPLSGCAEATGTAQIFVEPEDTVSDGLNPGESEENIKDGWTVTYDRFLVAVGNARASRSDSDEKHADPSVFVLDLRNAPAGGYVITTFEDIAATRWDRFGFDLPNTPSSAQALAPTSDADLAFMIENGFSIYIEGSITKCPIGGTCDPASEITFRWGLSAGTAFDDCATEDGFTGFAVPEGGTAQVKPTIHGDHWFFNNITSGAEQTKRLAQYIADCDLDMNGETTLDELKQAKAADVLPSSNYNLSGALTGPINTAFDYVLAQARTLGDFQGDGECPTRKVLP